MIPKTFANELILIEVLSAREFDTVLGPVSDWKIGL